MSRGIKRVLSIDGGGVRGILPALFIRAIEERANRKTAELFDLAVGTSTGGIIALALTHDSRAFSPGEILEIYLDHASKIIGHPRSSAMSAISRPQYKNDGLRDLCKLIFGEGRLGAAKIPTAVTCYDIAELRPRILRSWGDAEVARIDCFLWEAALATSAAPTYFPAVRVGEGTLIDGGVFANNPSALALAEARNMWPDDEIVLVSLGTGVGAKLGHLLNVVNSWGSLRWAKPLIDIMFDGSSDSVDHVCRSVLGGSRYHRFQINLNPELSSMDEVSAPHVQQLRAAGAREVNNQSGSIAEAVAALELTQQVKAGGGASPYIRVSSDLLADSIRCSFSALLRIEAGNRFLLVKGARIKHQYQPVGGVYKRLPPSLSELQTLDVEDDDKMPVDEDSRDDLRVRVPGRNIQKFYDWFQSRRGREIDPWREFYEELIVTEILDAKAFPYISASLYRTHVSGVRWSDHMQCNELLVSEIFVMHPTGDQLSHLLASQRSAAGEIKWVTQSEIFNTGLEEPCRSRSDCRHS